MTMIPLKFTDFSDVQIFELIMSQISYKSSSPENIWHAVDKI